MRTYIYHQFSEKMPKECREKDRTKTFSGDFTLGETESTCREPGEERKASIQTPSENAGKKILRKQQEYVPTDLRGKASSDFREEM